MDDGLRHPRGKLTRLLKFVALQPVIMAKCTWVRDHARVTEPHGPGEP